MTIQEIEKKAWEMDGVRIVIRGPEGEELGDYLQQNAAQATWNVSKYLDARIKPLIGNREVTVISGDGEKAHGRTLLSSVRASYDS